MQQNKQIILTIIGTALIVSLVATAVFYAVTLQSQGTIYTKTINCAAYSDASATQPITSINWGSLPSDSTTAITIYVVNTGNNPCNYTVSFSNFNPSNLQEIMTLTADIYRNNAPPNSITPCILTETIDPNTKGITAYSYTITITASG